MAPLRLTALICVGAAAVCLAGAFWLPFVHADFVLALPPWVPQRLSEQLRSWLIAHARLPVGDQYLGEAIRALFRAREYFIGSAILLFSVLFPVVKIVLSGALAGGEAWLSATCRSRLLRALAVAGKWSMADVFIVAMVIVFFKADRLHFSFRAQAGIYCYAAAALLSSAAVAFVQRAERRHGRRIDLDSDPDPAG
jgi:hypothetical protein